MAASALLRRHDELAHFFRAGKPIKISRFATFTTRKTTQPNKNTLKVVTVPQHITAFQLCRLRESNTILSYQSAPLTAKEKNQMMIRLIVVTSLLFALGTAFRTHTPKVYMTGPSIDISRAKLGQRQLSSKDVSPRSSSSISAQLTTIKLLLQMMSKRKLDDDSKSSDFKYSDGQIEEKIRQHKINLSLMDSTTGTVPLRNAIRLGRKELCRILMRHGASPMAFDKEGQVIYEAVRSDAPGSLHMLTELLESLSPADIQSILQEESHLPLEGSEKEYALRFAKLYWLQRGLKHVLPPHRLADLGLARLNALKYRIIGQSFALEQILGEVSSYHVNSELSDKPLVLLFSGPPGHGKTETAKQLADLLSCPFHKVDCRNHATPWEMFGAGVGYIGSNMGTQLSSFITEHQGKRNVVCISFQHLS